MTTLNWSAPRSGPITGPFISTTGRPPLCLASVLCPSRVSAGGFSLMWTGDPLRPFRLTVNIETDRVLIFGRRRLERVLAEYLVHDNEHRPHRSLGQLAPLNVEPPPLSVIPSRGICVAGMSTSV